LTLTTIALRAEGSSEIVYDRSLGTGSSGFTLTASTTLLLLQYEQSGFPELSFLTANTSGLWQSQVSFDYGLVGYSLGAECYLYNDGGRQGSWAWHNRADYGPRQDNASITKYNTKSNSI